MDKYCELLFLMVREVFFQGAQEKNKSRQRNNKIDSFGVTYKWGEKILDLVQRQFCWLELPNISVIDHQQSGLECVY